MSDTYRKSTKSFVTAINNGWLFNIQNSINTVFEKISQMILTREPISRTTRIFHAKAVKELIEKETLHGIEIDIIEDLVCSPIQITINIDYNQLSDAEYYKLCETVKNSKYQLTKL
jgi:hypothetical protein